MKMTKYFLEIIGLAINILLSIPILFFIYLVTITLYLFESIWKNKKR